MSLQVPSNAGNFLRDWWSVCLSRGARLDGAISVSISEHILFKYVFVGESREGQACSRQHMATKTVQGPKINSSIDCGQYKGTILIVGVRVQLFTYTHAHQHLSWRLKDVSYHYLFHRSWCVPFALIPTSGSQRVDREETQQTGMRARWKIISWIYDTRRMLFSCFLVSSVSRFISFLCYFLFILYFSPSSSLPPLVMSCPFLFSFSPLPQFIFSPSLLFLSHFVSSLFFASISPRSLSKFITCFCFLFTDVFPFFLLFYLPFILFSQYLSSYSNISDLSMFYLLLPYFSFSPSLLLSCFMSFVPLFFSLTSYAFFSPSLPTFTSHFVSFHFPFFFYPLFLIPSSISFILSVSLSPFRLLFLSLVYFVLCPFLSRRITFPLLQVPKNVGNLSTSLEPGTSS